MGRPESIIDQACRKRGAALMGVCNLTPDSFYDGGRYLDAEAAKRRVDELIAQGADIIDIGGESTRPQSVAVTAAEQISRIDPALRYAIASGKAAVSVDTTEPEVALHALRLGAHIINDVSCLADPNLARVAAEFDASLIIMHSRGPMSGMSGFSSYPESGYRDVVKDVWREWQAARERAVSAGMSPHRIWFDPGIGYNKNARHSFELLARLGEFQAGQAPLVVGPSRKSFIESVDEGNAALRLGGTIAACLSAVARGATVLRVHDVRDLRQALAVTLAVAAADAREHGNA